MAIHDRNHDVDDGGETDVDGADDCFQRYTAAVELAGYCEQKISQMEFEDALEAAEVLKGM